MSRLEVSRQTNAEAVMGELYAQMDRRMQAYPTGNCPVEQTKAFLSLCLAQSCGKCVPCRVGLDALCGMLEDVLEGRETDLQMLEDTASAIYDSADCAIGYEAAGLVLQSIRAFREDFEAHIAQNRCTAAFAPVPCMQGCPAHVDVPGYIALTKAGRYADAVRLIRKDNPFPSVCALICEHPCEAHCRRTLVDAPVNIRALKRYAVDHAGIVPPPQRAAATGKKVAVIGGGPGGLTAAYYLSLMGHQVHVYEKRAQLGGMLRYGIPCYRLPDEYLDRDIEAILSLGVQTHLSCKIGSDVTLETLRAQYDALYISIGAHSDNKLGLENESAAGVLSAVEFLGNLGEKKRYDFTGKKVVIVGGGNVAMDAVRSALRCGAQSVKCVYRRRIEDMTALPAEVEGAVAEGCEMLQLMAPKAIETDDQGHVSALIARPQMISQVKWGRPAPTDGDQPDVRIPCDVLIVAIGQAIDSAHFEQSGIPAKRGRLGAASDGSVKNMPGVFTGGDCVSGPSTVIRAIEAGKTAAGNIDEYLGCHTDITVPVEIPLPAFQIMPPCGRAGNTEREAAERKNDFDLAENPLSEKEAIQECARCLRCDHFGCGALKGGRQTKW